MYPTHYFQFRQEDKDKIIGFPKRCHGLETLEVRLTTNILENELFHETVNDITRYCRDRNQFVLVTGFNYAWKDDIELPNKIKDFFATCDNMKTITIKQCTY